MRGQLSLDFGSANGSFRPPKEPWARVATNYSHGRPRKNTRNKMCVLLHNTIKAAALERPKPVKRPAGIRPPLLGQEQLALPFFAPFPGSANLVPPPNCSVYWCCFFCWIAPLLTFPFQRHFTSASVGRN